MNFLLKTFFQFNYNKSSYINKAKNIQHAEIQYFELKINLHMSKKSSTLVI